MAQDPHQADAQVYNAMVGRTTLTNIRLTDTRFEMKADALGSDPLEWRKEVRRQPTDVYVDSETGRLFGSFRFELICREKRKRVFSCSAIYLLSYRVQGGCEQDIGQLFIERVGPVVLYPYFRATVAHLASQAAVQLPPLPLVSIAPRSVKSAAELEELRADKPSKPKPRKTRPKQDEPE